MLVETTDNGMKYDWYVTGPQGARFNLYRLESHTKEQIEAAKAQLKREQDVVKIYVIKVSQKDWDDMLLFLHPNSEMNRKLNKEYYAQL